MRPIAGVTTGGAVKTVLVDSTGAIITSQEAGTSATVQISDGTNTATITDVSGKKSVDVNVTDITLNYTNDSVTSHSPVLIAAIDDASTPAYYGFAVPGTATSAASWQIFKLTSTRKLYADGNGNFDNIWDNRAALSYS